MSMTMDQLLAVVYDFLDDNGVGDILTSHSVRPHSCELKYDGITICKHPDVTRNDAEMRRLICLLEDKLVDARAFEGQRRKDQQSSMAHSVL